MTTEDGAPETEEEIQERIETILAEIDDLSMDTELSPAEILVRLALRMIDGCSGKEDQTAEERTDMIKQFFASVTEKAVAR